MASNNFDLAATVAPYTMATRERIELLMSLCEQAKGLEGDFVECGVCNGGSAAILARYAAQQGRLTYLFDSFKGLPEPTEIDGLRAKEFVGKCVGSIEKVEQVMKLVDADLNKIVMGVGWFQDTFKLFEIPKIAVLSLDSDWYSSELLCLEKFYGALVVGGFLYLDDYFYWPGCQKAAADFFESLRIKPNFNKIGHSAWHQKLI